MPSAYVAWGCAEGARHESTDMGRLRYHVHRHVHRDTGHPDRRHVAADDPVSTRHPARPGKLGPDRLPDARSALDPAHGTTHAPHNHALALRGFRLAVHGRIM